MTSQTPPSAETAIPQYTVATSTRVATDVGVGATEMMSLQDSAGQRRRLIAIGLLQPDRHDAPGSCLLPLAVQRRFQGTVRRATGGGMLAVILIVTEESPSHPQGSESGGQSRSRPSP